MGIFEPFREIGYVTTSIPFSVQRMNTETFVTVSIGKSWQIYNCAKLSLVLSGPLLPKKITALASFKEFTFAAYGTEIGVFKRAHQVATWSDHGTKTISLLLLGHHILSLDASGRVFMYAFPKTGSNPAPIAPIVACHDFSPTCLAHPDTYLNKVLLGGREGALRLLNVSTRRTVYEFRGWGSAVCCCAPSPALDVVAVGCADGSLRIHNIRHDRELFSFGQDARGAVTALSFRTDGRPLLASGTSSGAINVWNLEKRRVQSVMQEAHDGAVVSLHFFPGEPVLMSSSADNSVKMWVFDTSDGEPRLLRFRKGHGAPPLCLRFYGSGRSILSAGSDRAFRLFSAVQERQSRELSQRHVAKKARLFKVKEGELKLKPVAAFDSCEIRERDWCNVVTCHADTPDAYVWRLQHFAIGEHVLRPGSAAGRARAPVTACAISVCGNFAVLGTAGGWVERFNLQSGLSRGGYTEAGSAPAHPGGVAFVATDSTNTLVVSVGFDGRVKAWDFKGRGVRSGAEIGRPVSRCSYHRLNGLLAAATDDMAVLLYDVSASRTVRRFRGHEDRVTDMCFSEDGRWLLSSSMDGSLRIWDVVLARQIDVLYLGVPATTISLSPAMDMLATAHVDRVGISLWINRQLFQGGMLPLGREPSPWLEDGRGEAAIGPEEPELVTLSLLPKSQWQTLVDLDVIKLRNRPTEPPKKPDRAPFFLPLVPSLSGDVVFGKGDTLAVKEEKRLKMEDMSSKFLILLHAGAGAESFSEFTDYIKGLSPSGLDLELRMIQIVEEDDGGDDGPNSSLFSLEILLDYFRQQVSGRHDFEFVQAVIRLFLKIHGETVRTRPGLRAKAKELLEVQASVWEGVDKLFQSTRSVITFLTHSQF